MTWTYTSQAPAGWYPDPENPYLLRWWDGYQWTAYRAPYAPAPERSSSGWATAIVAGGAALAVMFLGLLVLGAATTASEGTALTSQGAADPIDRAYQATVYVHAPCGDDMCVGAATAISPTEFITAEHVVSDSDDATLIDAWGNEFAGSVVMSDRGADLALIETQQHGLPVVEVRSGSIEVGETAYAIGAPGDEMRITEGLVSDIYDNNDDGVLEVDTSADVDQGNSGGPLLDVDGRLIGVVKEENPEDDNQGWATLASEVLDFLSTGRA